MFTPHTTRGKCAPARRPGETLLREACCSPCLPLSLGLRDSTRHRPAATRVLPAKEGPLELFELGAGKPSRRENVDHVIGDLQLRRRDRRHVSAPAETSTNVLVKPRRRARQLVGEPVQLAHLIEQRLEPHVVDSHARTIRNLEVGAAGGRSWGGTSRGWVRPPQCRHPYTFGEAVQDRVAGGAERGARSTLSSDVRAAVRSSRSPSAERTRAQKRRSTSAATENRAASSADTSACRKARNTGRATMLA
jgi:hypothetical protein